MLHPPIIIIKENPVSAVTRCGVGINNATSNLQPAAERHKTK
jgi:hypothetical protein